MMNDLLKGFDQFTSDPAFMFVLSAVITGITLLIALSVSDNFHENRIRRRTEEEQKRLREVIESIRRDTPE